MELLFQDEPAILRVFLEKFIMKMLLLIIVPLVLYITICLSATTIVEIQGVAIAAIEIWCLLALKDVWTRSDKKSEYSKFVKNILLESDKMNNPLISNVEKSTPESVVEQV